jgi:pyrroline-5-carboxylate reductase
MKKIALIGCGNIGSRHLQALAKSSFNCEITIVEPNSEAKTLIW